MLFSSFLNHRSRLQKPDRASTKYSGIRAAEFQEFEEIRICPTSTIPRLSFARTIWLHRWIEGNNLASAFGVLTIEGEPDLARGLPISYDSVERGVALRPESGTRFSGSAR